MIFKRPNHKTGFPQNTPDIMIVTQGSHFVTTPERILKEPYQIDIKENTNSPMYWTWYFKTKHERDQTMKRLNCALEGMTEEQYKEKYPEESL